MYAESRGRFGICLHLQCAVAVAVSVSGHFVVLQRSSQKLESGRLTKKRGSRNSSVQKNRGAGRPLKLLTASRRRLKRGTVARYEITTTLFFFGSTWVPTDDCCALSVAVSRMIWHSHLVHFFQVLTPAKAHEIMDSNNTVIMVRIKWAVVVDPSTNNLQRLLYHSTGLGDRYEY